MICDNKIKCAMAKLRSIFGLAVVLLQLSQSIHSAKIFGYLMAAGRSHFIIHDSLLRGLAARGHDVGLWIFKRNFLFSCAILTKIMNSSIYTYVLHVISLKNILGDSGWSIPRTY